MNTLKLFFGGTPEQARAAYKAWWDQQQGIEIAGTPTLEQEGTGWKLTVWYRPALSN
jgi:hypothetical protein